MPLLVSIYSRVLRNAVRIDTDRAVADSGDVTLHVDATTSGDFVAANTDAGGGEVAGVGVGLEANEVGAEHAVEDLLAARETPEDLGARERRVDEETDSSLRKRLAEERRDEEKSRKRRYRNIHFFFRKIINHHRHRRHPYKVGLMRLGGTILDHRVR